MPPLFQPVKTTKSILDTTAIVDGKAYFVQDSEQLYFDYDQTRTEIRDIIVLDTEGARTSMLAPKNKFYFVIETAKLWLYKNGLWIEAAGSGSGGMNLSSQSFSAGSAIASVTLDKAIAGASSIVYINVDNISLLKSAYSLGEDGKTITFSEPITCELGIDVIYSLADENGVAALSDDFSVATTSNEVVTLTTTKSKSTSSSVQKDIVLTVGNTYQLNLTGHTNLSFGDFVEGQQGLTTLFLSVPDAYTLTLPANIKWKDGYAPNLEVDGTYILEFRSIDGGNTLYGSISKYM